MEPNEWTVVILVSVVTAVSLLLLAAFAVSKCCHALSQRGEVIASRRLEQYAKPNTTQLAAAIGRSGDRVLIPVSRNLFWRMQEAGDLQEATFSGSAAALLEWLQSLAQQPMIPASTRAGIWIGVDETHRHRVWEAHLRPYWTSSTRRALLFEDEFLPSDFQSTTSHPDLIDLDARRCCFMQYRSGERADNVKAVLRRWLRQNPAKQYKQSLNCVAVVLYHVFNDRDLTYEAFHVVAEVYLGGTLAGGALSKVAEARRLTQLLQVLTFWDPQLASCLLDMELHPELYAVAWLTTLFADFLSLDEAIRCWDIMLALDCRFPLFLAAAFLIQIRDRIMHTSVPEALVVLAQLKTRELDVDVAAALRHATILWSESPRCVGMLDYGPYAVAPTAAGPSHPVPVPSKAHAAPATPSRVMDESPVSSSPRRSTTPFEVETTQDAAQRQQAEHRRSINSLQRRARSASRSSDLDAGCVGALQPGSPSKSSLSSPVHHGPAVGSSPLRAHPRRVQSIEDMQSAALSAANRSHRGRSTAQSDRPNSDPYLASRAQPAAGVGSASPASTTHPSPAPLYQPSTTPSGQSQPGESQYGGILSRSPVFQQHEYQFHRMGASAPHLRLEAAAEAPSAASRGSQESVRSTPRSCRRPPPHSAARVVGPESTVGSEATLRYESPFQTKYSQLRFPPSPFSVPTATSVAAFVSLGGLQVGTPPSTQPVQHIRSPNQSGGQNASAGRAEPSGPACVHATLLPLTYSLELRALDMLAALDIRLGELMPVISLTDLQDVDSGVCVVDLRRTGELAHRALYAAVKAARTNSYCIHVSIDRLTAVSEPTAAGASTDRQTTESGVVWPPPLAIDPRLSAAARTRVLQALQQGLASPFAGLVGEPLDTPPGAPLASQTPAQARPIVTAGQDGGPSRAPPPNSEGPVFSVEALEQQLRDIDALFLDTEAEQTCVAAMEQTLVYRKFRRWPLQAQYVKAYCEHLANAAPQLWQVRGLCIVLFADTFESLVAARDMLVRCGVPCVVALSHMI